MTAGLLVATLRRYLQNYVVAYCSLLPLLCFRLHQLTPVLDQIFDRWRMEMQVGSGGVLLLASLLICVTSLCSITTLEIFLSFSLTAHLTQSWALTHDHHHPSTFRNGMCTYAVVSTSAEFLWGFHLLFICLLSMSKTEQLLRSTVWKRSSELPGSCVNNAKTSGFQGN